MKDKNEMVFLNYVVKDGQAVPENPYEFKPVRMFSEETNPSNQKWADFEIWKQSNSYATDAEPGTYPKERFKIVHQWYDKYEFEWREPNSKFINYSSFSNFYMVHVDSCSDIRKFARFIKEVDKIEVKDELIIIGDESELHIYDAENGLMEIAVIAGNSSNYLNIDRYNGKEIIEHIKSHFKL